MKYTSVQGYKTQKRTQQDTMTRRIQMHPRASLRVGFSYGCLAIDTTYNNENNLQPSLWNLKHNYYTAFLQPHKHKTVISLEQNYYKGNFYEPLNIRQHNASI